MPRALEIVGLSMRKSKRIEHVPNALSMIQEATARLLASLRDAICGEAFF